MRIDQRFAGWGLFLVLAGSIPLAIRSGVLDPATVAETWRLWPVLLVAAGLGLLLRATPLAWVSGIISALVGGLIVGGLLGAGMGSIGGTCDPGAADTPFRTSSGTLGAGARVSATLDCGRLDLRTAADDAWNVAGSSENGSAPVIDAGSDRLVVRPVERGTGLAAATGRSVDWRIVVPETADRYAVTVNAGAAEVRIGGGSGALSGTVNAGSLVADLTGSRVRTLDLTVNAGSGSVTLPTATLSGSLTVNAGSIELCAPTAVGLRLTTRRNMLGSEDYADRGLVRDGETWTTTNWATASERITLETTANAGSFSLNPEEGCR